RLTSSIPLLNNQGGRAKARVAASDAGAGIAPTFFSRTLIHQGPLSMVPPRIGLALGGGFARGIAHAGVLRAFDRHGIPLHCIPGSFSRSDPATVFSSTAR